MPVNEFGSFGSGPEYNTGGRLEINTPDIFKGQDDTPAIIINPRPLDFEQLSYVSPQTARVVSLASSLLSLMNSKGPTQTFLIGGLACSALVGTKDKTHAVYREHSDLDIFVPKHMIAQYGILFGLISPTITHLGENIIRVELDSNFGSPVEVVDALGVREPVEVDFFIYQAYGNKGVFELNETRSVVFDLVSSGRGSSRRSYDLYGYNLDINESAVTAMKKLDTQRSKGCYDLLRLRQAGVI